MGPGEAHWISVGTFDIKEKAETFSKYLSTIPQVTKIVEISVEGRVRYRVLRLIPKKTY